MSNHNTPQTPAALIVAANCPVSASCGVGLLLMGTSSFNAVRAVCGNDVIPVCWWASRPTLPVRRQPAKSAPVKMYRLAKKRVEADVK